MLKCIFYIFSFVTCVLGLSEKNVFGAKSDCVNNLYVENNAWFTITIKLSGQQNWEENRTGRLPWGKTFCVIPGDHLEISMTGPYVFPRVPSIIPKDRVLKIICSGSLIGRPECKEKH